MNPDMSKVEAFAGQVVTDIAAAFSGVMANIGHKLGLYKAMAGAGWMRSEQLAEKTCTDERYVREWLQAGILEPDGTVNYPERGSPQGGSVSPILANIYLHYALDVWFEETVKAHCQGAAHLCRYADDCMPRRRTLSRQLEMCSHAA